MRDEVGFEFGLIGFVAPGSVAAGAFDFAEVAEFAGGGDQDVVNENGGIAFDAEALGELRSAEIFADKGDATGIFGGDFLDQQTCWIGNISSVGPADERELDGLGVGLLERSGGLGGGEVGGKDLAENDLGAAEFVGARRGSRRRERVAWQRAGGIAGRWNRHVWRRRIFVLASAMASFDIRLASGVNGGRVEHSVMAERLRDIGRARRHRIFARRVPRQA